MTPLLPSTRAATDGASKAEASLSHPEISASQLRLKALAEFDFSAAHALLRDVSVLARMLFSADSPHLPELAHVHFKPRDILYNSGHYMNGVVWREASSRLDQILCSMSYEFQLAQQSRAELQMPEKITLRWLFGHVPVTLWLVAAGAATSVFLLGFGAAKVELFVRLIDLLAIAR